ncbi:glycosyltransferase family 2 protein [Saccharibacillus alkalitolerans]|uniref:Glycosyltransferase family 2 protein n=1 Tax=Saccharibacillus alkalitolerans TaxID=2705290 RepID=A0ABX0F8B8_9BACL|nr:glycosyltransferase family 2 protein [Saccharibacillus alkalitolerans]NGZ77198.1 glycosyltransferase family 2 protein [Saccharibacillus alkalitolerans]
MDKLYLVIPCYNEEEVIGETAARLRSKMNALIARRLIAEDSRVVFVNDGSRDRTWTLIEELHRADPLFAGINLARNRGHQNALLAGLLTVKEHADVVISLDADLQDDIGAIDEFVDKYRQGFDIVYGVRKAREKDTFFKRATAQGFYRLMSMMGAELVYNHADYRLMSRRALDGLAEFGEANLFLRGIVPLIGYPSAIVEYERSERFAGESKYPLKKMLAFALQGITSFSIKPIRMISALGFFIFAVSLIMLGYFLSVHFTGHTVPGWTTIAISVWAIGGLQLLGIGVIGEYIGKTYLETKRRPKFIVERTLGVADGGLVSVGASGRAPGSLEVAGAAGGAARKA